MGAPEVRTFLTWLAVERNVAAATQNQALNALVFLYKKVLNSPLGDIGNTVRAKKPPRLPTVLTHQEAMAVITAMKPPYKLMASLMYGSGLWVVETARLRIKDIDFERQIITVRNGKGDKDRTTILPESFLQHSVWKYRRPRPQSCGLLDRQGTDLNPRLRHLPSRTHG